MDKRFNSMDANIKNRYHRLWWLFIMLYWLSGCATISDIKKMEDLEKTVDAYSLAIQWSDFEAASRFRMPGQAPGQYVNPDTLKDFQVISYQTKNQVLSADGKRMERIAKIRYYKKNEMKEKKVSSQEVWQYDTVRKTWWLKTPLPTF